MNKKINKILVTKNSSFLTNGGFQPYMNLKQQCPTDLWRCVYRNLKIDILGDFRTKVSDKNTSLFEKVVCRIALGCNQVIVLVGTDKKNDLIVVCNDILKNVRTLPDLVDDKLSQVHFEETSIAIQKHLAELINS